MEYLVDIVIVVGIAALAVTPIVITGYALEGRLGDTRVGKFINKMLSED